MPKGCAFEVSDCWDKCDIALHGNKKIIKIHIL
jgi:hypothetical protein